MYDFIRSSRIKYERVKFFYKGKIKAVANDKAKKLTKIFLLVILASECCLDSNKLKKI